MVVNVSRRMVVVAKNARRNKTRNEVKNQRSQKRRKEVELAEKLRLEKIEKERKENTLFYEDDEDEEPYDPSVFVKNKNKVKINVKKKY